MIITTIDPIATARAIVAILKDSPALQDKQALVERGEPLNEDPGKCPWIGVYPLRVPFPSRTLGMGGGFRAENPEFAVVFQTTHPNDGAACQDELGELVRGGTSALLSDPSLGGTVAMLGDFEVEFNGERKINDSILQVATLRVVGLTTVSGG
jgi:hypothetical protein